LDHGKTLMIEVTGNLWEYEANYRCITTNGTVKRNGCGVMGRGCALEATQRYPDIAEVLGDLLSHEGNHVHELGYSIKHSDETRPKKYAWDLISFPVKHNWREKADLGLIHRSAEELVELIDRKPDNYNLTIVVPRPGCGNGQRDWESEVKPLIEPILDDRFVIITF
jgi:hypothetical protein